MYGGQDNGFALWYWGLSYRRKFICSVVATVLGTAIVVAYLVSQPDVFGWPWYAALPFVILGGIWQCIYTYRRWQI
jgi:hypothetical protein